MLLTTVISAVLYKDRPSKKQALAFLVGIVAILMIGLL
jgi:drug/metabolite transporter (DMT)-like permease